MDIDKGIQRAIAIGEANKRTLELVQNWCAHIVIDGRGSGLVEQFTSLPIGPRSLSCRHAAAPGFMGMDLKFIALDFHDRNCRGCAQRGPVRLPNLSSLVNERDAAHAAEVAELARREAAMTAALKARDAKRAAVRARLTPPSVDVIDQIEELDHNREDASASHLVETAKLAPDMFTAPVVEYAFELIEAGEFWFDNAGLRLLVAVKADKARLTRCALLCLPRLVAAEAAAEVLIENLALADERLVGLAVPTLVDMANPRRLALAGYHQRSKPAPLLGVYKAFPRAVEGAFAGLLDEADPDGASQAARGIIALATQDRALPVRFARSLIGRFIRDRRLLQADEYHGIEGEILAELRQAIALAFDANATATDRLLGEFMEGASETGETRLLSVYREVLRHQRFDDDANTEVTEAGRLALNRVVSRATETQSYAVLREISNLFSGRPWGAAKLAAQGVRHLLGAAIVIDGKLRDLVVPPALDDPSGVAMMERASQQDVMRDLRDRLVAWAAAGAGQALDETAAYLEVLEGLRADGSDALVSGMIGNINELMQTTQGLTAALPSLYTALVGASVSARARAAYAIGELDSRQQDKLPPLIFETFVVLLADPYKMVHQYALHALRRTRLPETFRAREKAALLRLILAYVGDRSDERFLVECLAFYIARYADPPEFVGNGSLWLISVLEKVRPYVAAAEVRTFTRVLKGQDGHVRLLTRLIGDKEAWDIYHEQLTQALAELPGLVVRRHWAELEALASNARRQGRRMDGLFVELFTRAGAWQAAASLAAAGFAELPDDAWTKPRKLAAGQLRVATAFEAALASRATEHARSLAEEWKSIGKMIERDRAENARRRDPLQGLRGQN